FSHFRNANAIILHSVNSVLNLQRFFADFRNKPVVWTLHDMNPFQGVFHYKEDELRNASVSKMLEEMVVNIKKKAYAQKPKKLTITAPSQWLAEKAKNSILLGN